MKSQIKIASFGAMAMKSMQDNKNKNCGKEGDPGWIKRRQITLQYLAANDFDFVGLQHCHVDTKLQYDAVEWFRSNLQKQGFPYGIINEPYGKTAPESGDSAPLFFRKDRWSLIASSKNAEYFLTPIPSEDHVSKWKGRSFVWGLFQNYQSGKVLCVYHLHLSHGKSRIADLYRKKCLMEVRGHILRNCRDVPVVLFGDFNVLDDEKETADRYIKSLSDEDNMPMLDTFLQCNPNLEAKVRTQHDYVEPKNLYLKNHRNSRILLGDNGRASIVESQIVPVVVEDMCPSYTHPVEAVIEY